MNEKIMIFDASSLISFAMNGLLPELIALKRIFNGKFVIPDEVKYEIIDRPLHIKRFELEALQLNELLKNGILELPEKIDVSKVEISHKTEKMLEIANATFFERGKKEIHLIDLGETACLVLSKILNFRGIENLLVIDERTTRMLCEKPDNLRKLLQKKLHTKVDYSKEKVKPFLGLKIVRSTELMYLIYKKGLVRIKDNRIFDALLFALKYKGCAISSEEIQKIKRLL